MNRTQKKESIEAIKELMDLIASDDNDTLKISHDYLYNFLARILHSMVKHA